MISEAFHFPQFTFKRNLNMMHGCHSLMQLNTKQNSRAVTPPPQLTSWINKGLNLGPVNDVPILQSRIRDLLERDVSLVSVMQVMQVRRVPPCKRRPLCMWEFNPEGPQTIQHFLGQMLEGMYQLYFGSRIKCPVTIKDAGLDYNRPDSQVSNSVTEHTVIIFVTTLL